MKNISLNLKTKELMKRAVSFITAVAMVMTILPLQPITVYAEETGAAVCIHHVHNEECGYVAAVDEVPCTHQHDEGCGFVAAVAEVLCECTETDENGAVLHNENCGYTPEAEEQPCTHTHDESCGYIAAVAGASCTWTAESCTECNPVNNSEAEPAADSTPDVPSEETEPAVDDEQDIKNGETEPIVECICETDDETIHAANCPLYTPVENPQCFCGEKCTKETLNYWCDVCGVQGVVACQAAEEETAVVYAGYSYTDQHGTIHTVDNATEITEDSTTWSDGWYYVKDYVSIGERITVNGDVTLILGITAHLEALQGIKVSGGNSLTIYGATADSGLLYAYSYLSNAAIGSNGNVTIDDDGDINISSDADTTLGTITINSGRVIAEVVADDNYSTSAAIGGGRYSKGGTININGGDVYAKTPSDGGGYAPAIGPGELSSGDVTINITGGTVTAEADLTAIGSIVDDGCSLTLNISGGNITAASYETDTAFVTIGSGASSGNAEVNITGGIIDAASIGSHLYKDVLTVKGGKFVQDPAASLPKGMYTVQGTDDLYTAHWGGAYIEGITQVESISVMVNGTAQTLAADDYKIIDGKLHLFVSNGMVAATVNGKTYSGNHTSVTTKLTEHIKIDDLTISPDTIAACKSQKFTATVATSGAEAVKLEYRITDPGTTGAHIRTGTSILTEWGGVFKLTVTATDTAGLIYSETFDITSVFTNVTGISGDSVIPQTSDPAVIELPTQVLPADATKKEITWSFADENSKNYADLTYSELYLINEGTVKLRATVEDGLGEGVDFTNDYTINVTSPTTLDISEGGINFSKYDDNNIQIEYGYGYGITAIIPADKIVTITGTSNAGKSIRIISGEPKIVLKDCNIIYSGGPAISISSGAKADITLAGTNTLNGNCAIGVPGGAQLVIGGTGTLKAETVNKGVASIGGVDHSGSITINGGTITATSGDAAAIGSGRGCNNDGGITINGGTIIATADYGSAIGSGSSGDNSGGITINGGNITAISESGAAIGNGYNGSNSGGVTINGGTVTATGDSDAAIGGTGGTVNITDGHITATAGGYCAGIGGDNVAVSISGGTVIATGGNYCAGIGANNDSTCGTINISGGTVTATGGNMAAGIGSENKGAVNITISGGTVTATGGNMAAGIGNGRSNDSGGSITISGGTVTATGGSDSAGIGGGYHSDGCDVVITGGTVTATGGTDAAGIGGGYRGAGGAVVITGGNIKATAGNRFAAAIGNGRDGAAGTLTDGTNNVELRTITLDGAVSDTAVTSAVLPQGASYGIKDVKTLDTDKLYFYLPSTAAVNSITAGTAEYICNRNNTYYTVHGTSGYTDITETTHDEICSECNAVIYDNEQHRYGADSKCVCGHTDHIHSWQYTADESTDTITANCTEDGCPLTNADGGSVKISAAGGEYAGNAVEAVVTDNLTTGDTYTVTYTGTTCGGAEYNSTAAPTDAGSYTAILSMGDESVSADFEITPKELIPSFRFFAPNPKTYDGTTELPVMRVNVDNIVAVDDIGIGDGVQAHFEDAHVGENKTVHITNISLTGDDAANYTVKNTYTTTWSISPAPITVTPKAGQTKVYGTEDPEFEYEITSGQLFDEDTLTGALGRTTGENVDQYAYNLGSLANPDYDITLEATDKFEITQATPDLSGVVATIADNSTSEEDVHLDGAKGVDGSTLTGSFAIVSTGPMTWGENTVGFTFIPDDANYTSAGGTTTVTVKDTVVPTGEVKVEENSWTEFVNDVTFGLLFNKTVDVTVTAADALSGVKSVEYIESGEALTLETLQQIANWNPMGADRKVSVTAEDSKQFVYYIRITDNAGNVTYLSTDGATFDTQPPVIHGITEGTVYYTTQRFTVEESNLENVTVNGNQSTTFALGGNVDREYVVVAADKAGNSTKVTVQMKTIASISETIKDLTENNVTGDNTDTIKAVEEALEAVDKTNASPAEKDEIAAAQENIDALQKVIEDTEKEVSDIETEADALNPETVTSDDKAEVEQFIGEMADKLNDTNLTEEQKDRIQQSIDEAEEILDKIAEDQKALEDAIADQSAVTDENVTADNAEDLAAAKDKLEDLKADDNYTEEEKAEIQEEIDRIEGLEKVIEDTEKEVSDIEAEADALNPDTVTSDDKAEIEQFIGEMTDKLNDTNLTEEQKDRIQQSIDEAEEIIEKIAEDQKALEDAIADQSAVTDENVTADNAEDLAAAKDKLEDLKADDNYTEAEKAEIQEEIDRIEALEKVIEDTEKEVSDIEAEAGALNPDTVTSDDKAEIEQFIGEMTDKLNDTNLTEEQKDRIQQSIDEAKEILDKIAEDQEKLNDALDSVSDVDTDDITDDDIDNLQTAKENLEELLNDENYTTEEKAEIQDKLDEIKDIANDIGETYEIIHGENGKWTKGSSKTLGFTANGLFKLFKEVRVDGIAIIRDVDYTAQSGSTIVTLNKSYLDTLSVGEHKLEVVYDVLGTEHIADCEFTVKAKPVDNADKTEPAVTPTPSPAPTTKPTAKPAVTPEPSEGPVEEPDSTITEIEPGDETQQKDEVETVTPQEPVETTSFSILPIIIAVAAIFIILIIFKKKKEEETEE